MEIIFHRFENFELKLSRKIKQLRFFKEDMDPLITQTTDNQF